MIHILNFPHPLNVSVQPTDVLYASLAPGGQSGTNHPSASVNTAPVAIGIVISINRTLNTVTYDDTTYTAVTLTNNHYIYFGKNKTANISGIIGYFAETEYRNYTKVPAEIFATAMDYVENSK